MRNTMILQYDTVPKDSNCNLGRYEGDLQGDVIIHILVRFNNGLVWTNQIIKLV